jgi:3-dehydroquinate synthetase
MEEIRLYVRENFSVLPELLRDEGEVYLVYDRNVSWAAEQIRGLCALKGFYAIDASEAAKNMDTVLGICRFLLDAGADRKALVLALGGGITTDMAGFAASIYKRGVRFATLPTTLLAQVDAGIGGKTGVNLDGYKNILGVIRQPEFIYTAGCTLETLPEREFRSGVAEMLKTFIISDAPHYRRALGLLRSGARPDTELIRAAAAIKCGVVERDEFETGERRVLNLGHTVGHAVEWWQTRRVGPETGYPAGKYSQGTPENALPCGQTPAGYAPNGPTLRAYSHGEAVAIGIVQAARLSESLGVCRRGLAAQLEADFAAVGLPTICPVSPSEMRQAIARDKKADGGSVHFVLIKDIGKVEVRLLPVDTIIQRLEIANL